MDERIAVSFPNLGIDINVSRVAFKVFNTPIYWYGILIALAFMICVLWAMKDSPKYGLVSDTVIDLMLFAAPVAIICARLYYVVFSWEDYKYDLKQIFDIRQGGLAIYGGIIGAIVTAYFVARYKKIPTFKFFDVFIPYVALGQAIGRWGNFFNQEAFGTNTTLPWGMTSPATRAYLANNAQSLKELNGITVYPDLPVHPTFLYESLWDLIVFAILLKMRKKKKFDGEVFCLYFVTYSIGRAFIEGLRTDSLMIGHLRVSQLLSVVLAIVFGIFIIYKRVKNVNSEVTEAGHSNYAGILKIMEEEEALESEQQLQNDTTSEIKTELEDPSAENPETMKDELSNTSSEDTELGGKNNSSDNEDEVKQ